jgi:hypothetical protein
MSPAGYSGTPLPKKLGIREGSRVGTRHAPGHVPDLLDPLPSGVRVEALGASAHPGRGERFDVVLLFVDEIETLTDDFAPLSGRIEIDGGLWVCWPKMKSPLFRELRESDVRAHGLETGLVDNKICAVDEDWSGLRFVHRREDRPALQAARGETA